MPTYFGQQTQTLSDNQASDNFFYTGVSFACPGSGNQNIQELSFMCHMNSSGSGQACRLGVYTTAGAALVAEGTSAVTIVGNTLIYQGHMSQAAVKAAGGATPGVLVGGVNYVLAVFFTGGSAATFYGYTTGGTSDQVLLGGGSSNYSSGMPSAVPGGTTTEGHLTAIRCGVNPAVTIPDTPIRPPTTVSIVP